MTYWINVYADDRWGHDYYAHPTREGAIRNQIKRYLLYRIVYRPKQVSPIGGNAEPTPE